MYYRNSSNFEFLVKLLSKIKKSLEKNNLKKKHFLKIKNESNQLICAVRVLAFSGVAIYRREPLMNEAMNETRVTGRTNDYTKSELLHFPLVRDQNK